MDEDRMDLRSCLYLASNSFARTTARLADDLFRPTGLSPSHAFVLLLVDEKPGLTPKELAEALSLAPSTITRFTDRLVAGGLVSRSSAGRTVRLEATAAGHRLAPGLRAAWRALRERLEGALGGVAVADLAERLEAANGGLSGRSE